VTKVTTLQGIRKPSTSAGLKGRERLASPTREAEQKLQDRRSLHAVTPLHIAAICRHVLSFYPCSCPLRRLPFLLRKRKR
jgi:hypothetical protein